MCRSEKKKISRAKKEKKMDLLGTRDMSASQAPTAPPAVAVATTTTTTAVATAANLMHHCPHHHNDASN